MPTTVQGRIGSVQGLCSVEQWLTRFCMSVAVVVTPDRRKCVFAMTVTGERQCCGEVDQAGPDDYGARHPHSPIL